MGRGTGVAVTGSVLLFLSLLWGWPSAPLRAEETLEPTGGTSSEATVIREGESEDVLLARPWEALQILDYQIVPGERRRLFLRSSESFAGDSVDIPVLVVHGRRAGPVVCLIAGVHGDELNGIEIVRQIFEHVSPTELGGTLLGVPVANLHGFRRSSRYLPDRRDLNRYFPGHPAGSSASRVANALFEGVVRRCDALVDFHTGSFHRTNLPQLRANLRDAQVLELARAIGIGVVVHSEGSFGTLRRATTDVGIPAITYEAGEPTRFQSREINRGVEGVRNMLRAFGMLDGDHKEAKDQRIYYRSRWVRVNEGGIFITSRKLGERIETGDVLGTVTDPVSNERSRVIAPFAGSILGMAVPQVVIPGFAAFHIGIGTEPLADVAAPETVSPPPVPPPRRDEGAIPTPDQLDVEEHPE